MDHPINVPKEILMKIWKENSMTETKPINEMTEKEILRRQLELLAESSNKYSNDPFAVTSISNAMCNIYDTLSKHLDSQQVEALIKSLS